jgi:hypothetical protein
MNIVYNEYSLELRTKERIEISELNLEMVDMEFREYLMNGEPPLDRLPRIPFHVMEEAKIGYDSNFRNMIGSSPESIIERLPNKLCFQRKICASYKYEPCYLRISKKREKKAFPICWEYEEEDSDKRYILSSIIGKVREGRRVIIVY